MSTRVMCPLCECMNPMVPAQVKGTVLEEPNPGQTVARQNVTYPVANGLGNECIYVVRCGACSKYFVAMNKREDYGVVLWPLPGSRVPTAVPEKVGEAYLHARLALAAGSLIGAVMAGRVTLIRVLRDVRETRDASVSQFTDLLERRLITSALFGAANNLRLWANIVGHDDLPTSPFDRTEVGEILDYLGTLLEAVYTHPARVAALAKRTEELKGGQATK